jgi:hypothetical protein
MMNTLVQSMRSARKKKIKLTIIHQNLHPRVGLFTVQFIFSFVFCLFVYFPFSLAASNEIDAPLILQLGTI